MQGGDRWQVSPQSRGSGTPSTMETESELVPGIAGNDFLELRANLQPRLDLAKRAEPSGEWIGISALLPHVLQACVSLDLFSMMKYTSSEIGNRKIMNSHQEAEPLGMKLLSWVSTL